MKQFRSRRASLWQSAVDEVVAKEAAGSGPAAGLHAGPAAVKRPASGPEVTMADVIGESIENQKPIPPAAPPSPAAGVGDVVRFCSVTAFRLAEARVRSIFSGDDSELKKLEQELKAPFALCDPKWAGVIEAYVANRVLNKGIPYRRHKDLNDFVIVDRLPDNGTVALIADWGTGQAGAQGILRKIAAKRPEVVIHLGDVYYSGTESEFKNYFYAIWQKILGIPKVAWGEKLTDLTARPATYSLAGNHDMYAGGAPYYTLIDMLGQPASYFCLRNKEWQFIAMDTGLHDSDPTAASSSVTFLEPTETAWIKDKVDNAGGRKTVLLSHHQLFTAFDRIGEGPLNETLASQLKDILPKVTIWFWGHEHNLVLYPKFHNVLARCVGHGAFPVGVDEPLHQDTDVPVEALRLSPTKTGGLFQHGYVLVKLNGAGATVKYLAYDPDTDAEAELFTENL